MVFFPLLTQDIPKRARQCMQCQAPFSPGHSYRSSLIQEDKGGLKRFDFCEECFSKRNFAEKGIYGSWRGTLPKKEEKSSKVEEKLLEELQRLLSSAQEEDRQVAFILGLHLVRRRFLALRKSAANGQGSLYEVLETGELLAIPHYILTDIASESLQAKVDSLLKNCGS